MWGERLDHGQRSGFAWAARSQLFRLRSRRERPTFCRLGESALPFAGPAVLPYLLPYLRDALNFAPSIYPCLLRSKLPPSLRR